MFVKLSNFSKFCKSFFNKQSFFIQIFIINSIISICILSAVTAVILLSSLIHTKQILISNCRNMATNLAQNYIVYDALVSKRATRRLLTYLDNTLDKSDTIDSITIIDTNRICLYHYDHAVTGTTIPVIPEEYDDQITTISIGTDERGRPIKQLSAVVPILNGSGAEWEMQTSPPVLHDTLYIHRHRGGHRHVRRLLLYRIGHTEKPDGL